MGMEGRWEEVIINPLFLLSGRLFYLSRNSCLIAAFWPRVGGKHPLLTWPCAGARGAGSDYVAMCSESSSLSAQGPLLFPRHWLAVWPRTHGLNSLRLHFLKCKTSVWVVCLLTPFPLQSAALVRPPLDDSIGCGSGRRPLVLCYWWPISLRLEGEEIPHLIPPSGLFLFSSGRLRLMGSIASSEIFHLNDWSRERRRGRDKLGIWD